QRSEDAGRQEVALCDIAIALKGGEIGGFDGRRKQPAATLGHGASEIYATDMQAVAIEAVRADQRIVQKGFRAGEQLGRPPGCEEGAHDRTGHGAFYAMPRDSRIVSMGATSLG